MALPSQLACVPSAHSPRARTFAPRITPMRGAIATLDGIGAEAMRTWLRSVVDVILGAVPGKNGRLDTAIRMAMDAVFRDRREKTPPRTKRKIEERRPHRPF